MTMVEDYEENVDVEEAGGPGPGAPTPLTALEVRDNTLRLFDVF